MKEETVRLIKHSTKMSLFVAVALVVLSTMDVVAMYAYCQLLIMIIFNPFRDRSSHRKCNPAVCESAETIGDDMASISKIRKNKWKKLRLKEKIAVCQSIDDRYRKQFVEKEANEFAVYRSMEYYNKISRYCNKHTHDNAHPSAPNCAARSINTST